MDEGAPAARGHRLAVAGGGARVTFSRSPSTGRGARRSGRAGHPCRRRGAAARPRGVRDAARLRRRPFRLEAHLDRLAASAASIGSRSSSGGASQVLVGARAAEGGERRRVAAPVWTPGRKAPALRRARAPEHDPGWVERARERGASAVSLLGVRAVGAVAAPGRQVDELRGEHGRRGGGTRRVAPTRHLRRRRRDRARGHGHERLVAAGDDALHAVARPRDPRGRDAATLIELGTGVRLRGRGGRVSARRACSTADEAFTSSSVREVMPLVEVDGRRFERDPAAAGLQDALRRLAAAPGG